MSCFAAISTPAFVPLPWDSEQFGFPAARLDSLQAETPSGIAALVDCARSQGVRHLSTRVPVDDLLTIHSLESNGFHLLDGIQTFERALADPSPAPSLHVRHYQPPDLDALLDIARTAYLYDRFHADSAITTEQADRLHETWVRNSCLGLAADAVIVAEHPEAGDPASFVTCKINQRIGTIVLVATAKYARGLGLAHAATLGALAYFKSRDCTTVRVGTQLRNTPAGRLYQACGFRLQSVTLTYRKLL